MPTTVVRSDNQTGVLSSQLAAGTGVGGSIPLGTAWTGPTVSGVKVAKFVIDPPLAGTANPKYEVIYATVNNGATTATIVARAQEGTTAQTHVAGAIWECGATSLDFPGSSLGAIFNVKDYGAKGDNSQDDWTACNNARIDCEAALGVLYFPAGTYSLAQPLVIGASISVVGDGNKATIITARSGWAGSTGLLSITTLLKHVRFQDIGLDGAGRASYGHYISSAEQSGNHRMIRLRAFNCTAFAYYNTGNEDCTYLDCCTEGNEGAPLTVAPAMFLSVPAGLVTIVGGQLFGLVDVNVEQLTVIGCVLGPVFIDDSVQSHARYAQALFYGCYLYDGGTGTARACLSGTQLYQVTLDGCCFIAGSQPEFIGALSNMTASITIALRNCEMIVGASNTQPTVYLVDAIGGAGTFIFDGIVVDPGAATTVGVFGSGISNVKGGILGQFRNDIWKKNGTRFPLPSSVFAVTPGASPWSYQNTDNVSEEVTVYGGTVSAITLDAHNVGATSGSFRVPPQATLSVTYTVAPTVLVTL